LLRSGNIGHGDRAPSAAGGARRTGPLSRGCAAAALLLACLLSGCQCCCCGTNAYSAVIDCFADHPPCLECLYCAKLDATRINRPGGWQCSRCCCPQPHCCSSGVYAHRWNSPPVPEAIPAAGLLEAPELPAGDVGPYFPPASEIAPPAEDGSPTPLFGPQPPALSPPGAAASPGAASPRPAAQPEPQVDAPAADPGVVRMEYLAPFRDAPALQVPVDVLFGP
jgi:hypothetical protein